MPAAIETKYFLPTDTEGSRVIATGGLGNRIVVPYDLGITEPKNHAKAAAALREKLDWCQYGPLLGGHTKYGMAWVFAEHAERI